MRVSVYARVSGDRQKEEQTIESQLKEVLEFAAEHKWAIDDQRIYVDDGYSGYVFERPGLDRLRDTARDGLIDLVLVHDPDRLARKYAYQVLLLEEFQRWGVQARFVKQPPPDSPDQKLLVQIQGAISEYERARILERTRRGRLFWARQGRPVSSKVPFGYRYVPRTRNAPASVEVDAAEAKLVRDIFRWYTQDKLSLRQIALRLTADAAPTPMGMSSYWDPSSVGVILRCEAYLGNWSLKRHRTEAASGPRRRRRTERPREEWIPIPVQPIIESSVFVKAKELRGQQQRDASSRFHPLRHRYTHLLRRLVVCGSCKYKLTALLSNAGSGHRYYWCRGPDPRHLRPERTFCPHPTTVAEPLDDLVWSDVVALLTDPELVVAAWREQHHRVAPRQGELLDEEERRVNKQLNDTQSQRQRLLIAYEQGAIELEELISRRNNLDQKAEEIRRRLNSLSRDRKQGVALLDLGKNIDAVCKALASGLERMNRKQKMELCQQLIERVVVYDHSAEIHYRFPVSGNCNNRRERAGVFLSDPKLLSFMSGEEVRSVAEKLVAEILEPVPHRHFVLTIPRALRGLFERDRSLLGLLSQTAYEAIRRCFQALHGRQDVRPGCVASIQTFGSFGPNWNPHLHCLVTEGAFTPSGQFFALPSLDTAAIEELFRRLLLRRLHQAERLSGGFMRKLLCWSPSGFSLCARQLVMPDEPERLERLARYLTRPPLSLSSVELDEDGRVAVTLPPDPHSGETLMCLDPLEWIHAITSQILQPRQHATRSYGHYANRARGARRARSIPRLGTPEDDPPYIKARKASWARLLRKILEVDPLLCPRCGGVLEGIAVISDAEVIDHIVAHIEAGGGDDPFEPRGPPPQSSTGETATVH